mmetsp:Transcript_9940/g.11261  ORF Transcript_9940/g.11261 Transcript_9940/m.11261 type:complete len:133 (+) Transcript_9940:281-679(+)
MSGVKNPLKILRNGNKNFYDYIPVEKQKEAPIYIFGTKIDCKDSITNKDVRMKVQKSEINSLCSKIDAKYFKTSALTGDHVEDSFKVILKELYKMRKLKIKTTKQCIISKQRVTLNATNHKDRESKRKDGSS